MLSKYLILYIDGYLSIASHLRVLQAHVLPDCNGCNQYAFENLAHFANNAPIHDAAIFPVVFYFYGLCFERIKGSGYFLVNAVLISQNCRVTLSLTRPTELLAQLF